MTTKPMTADPMTTHHVVHVQAGQDRSGEPFEFAGERFTTILSGADTGGTACAFVNERHRPGGPASHVHPDQDEWFLVQEGRFSFRIGPDDFDLGPGDSLLAPRGVPHGFTSTTDTARMVVTFLPAGDMEAFFREVSALEKPTDAEMAAVYCRHGMTVVGPPLTV